MPVNESSTVAELDNELNQMILQGKALDAFEKFYGEDVTMQDNTGPATSGKDANREREKQFFGSIQDFHGVQCFGSAVNGQRSYSEWEFDVTFKGGNRVKVTETAVRQWANGKITHERFYHA